MFRSWLVLAALIFGLALKADHLAPREAPAYSSASVVNAADFHSGAFAPNTIATIFGTHLAYVTKGLTAADVHGGHIPTILPLTGVTVSVGNFSAGIYYISPTQINFLIPSMLIPGPSFVRVSLDALHGPDILIQISPSAPAFFQLDTQNVVATQPDGSVITPQNPAKPGDYAILYATGLGAVVPPLEDREIPLTALTIEGMPDFKITLDGQLVDPADVLYAGVCPGFAGLYQINLHLPSTVGANPAIQVMMTDQSSPTGLTLPVQP